MTLKSKQLLNVLATLEQLFGVLSSNVCWIYLHNLFMPTRKRFLLFSLITSLILLLIARSRSSMFRPILDLDLTKDLRRSVTHAGSRDEMQTVLNSMHLSMCLWIRVSKLFTALASSRSFVPRTLSQVSPTSSRYNAPPFGVSCNPGCEFFGEQVWVLIPQVKWRPCDPFLLI